jgi:hypothetical protein
MITPHLLPGVFTVRKFVSSSVREKRDASALHDLKRNGRRNHYAATKTLENEDNRPVLNASHSFTPRTPTTRGITIAILTRCLTDYFTCPTRRALNPT